MSSGETEGSDGAVEPVPAPPASGDPAVDQVVSTLAAAAQGTLEEQVAAFDAAHRTLHDRLADVDG